MPHGILHHMNDVKVDFGMRVNCLNSVRKAINTCDDYIASSLF
jgi:hypothetical protein